MPQSDRRQLADLALSRAGTNLDSVVATFRSQGLGWRGVSDRIDEHYGFRIHATTLMRWYTAEDIAA
jgi:intein-encoded DNA endonuclease-like protein